MTSASRSSRLLKRSAQLTSPELKVSAREPLAPMDLSSPPKDTASPSALQDSNNLTDHASSLDVQRTSKRREIPALELPVLTDKL